MTNSGQTPIGDYADEACSPSSADIVALRQQVLSKLSYDTSPQTASKREWFVAVALAVRERIVFACKGSKISSAKRKGRTVYYFSSEFLLGRLLSEAVGNLGLTEAMRLALDELGVDFEQICAQEHDPALGNGGLGRLAACFMESMATLKIPAIGYGIRYEFGLFRQKIEDGRQVEIPDDWLTRGNPWEVERPDRSYEIGFGGSVEQEVGPAGRPRSVWHPAETVWAVAIDTPIVGDRGDQVNTLRLWRAKSPEALQLETFNRGDHFAAHSARIHAEIISRVLYPGDEAMSGRELRLRQEYFFSAASLQDLLRRHIRRHGDVKSLPTFVAIQLNDTHPAIAVAELMRLLVDVYELEWGDAWQITVRVFSYTNHTLLPEALETWPIAMMEHQLPRHMQIIYKINAQHLDAARRAGCVASDLIAGISLIDESAGRRVRMSHLAFVGSHKINGVSALHTGLMRKTVFAALNQACPDRIVNKTNGITFRRWLHRANPGLTRLLVDTIGEDFLRHPEDLHRLSAYVEDASLQDRMARQRLSMKKRLAEFIVAEVGVQVDPDAMFDVHIKRVHEYKRQLLNILQTVVLYNAMRSEDGANLPPRVKIFAGKAAASYYQAKLIIRLIHDVARTINADPAVRGRLTVAFLPDYNVTLAEKIIPAADVSEQISTAGMEASGTGNMKLMLNGGLTIGTLDGANVEILEHVGSENIVIFGLTADEVEARRRDGKIEGQSNISASPILAGVLRDIATGVFSPPDEPERYRGLVDTLTHWDGFMVTADFDAYCAAQREVERRWLSPTQWWRTSLCNVANAGWFSSDRTIREYAEEIWNVPMKEPMYDRPAP